LNLSGVVRATEGQQRERNRIYARVFNGEWARSNLPKAELRRQRQAYVRGLVRATAPTTGVFLAMGLSATLAVRARHEAGEATWKALYRQARVNRASALPGQRFEALDSIRQASKIKVTSELTDEAIACLAMPDVRRQPSRNGPEERATCLTFTDDLKLYASSIPTGEIIVRRTSDDGEIKRWRAQTGPPERIWMSRDEQYLAAAWTSDDRTILSFWRWHTGEALFSLTNRMQLESFDFHPESKRIAVAFQDGLVRILALPGGDSYTDFPVGEPCS